MDASSRPGRPPSIPELVTQAENFAFNVNIPLRHWIRTAETLCQEAAFAMSDSDYGRAYMMLYRHSILVLNYMSTHPEYKDPLGRKSVKALQARIGDVIQELEMLKPAIEGSRQEWERMKPAKPRHSISTDGAGSSYPGYASRAARDPTLQRQTTVLDAAEHQDLAVDLAQEEVERRTRVRRTNKDSYKSRTTSLRPYFDSWRNDYLGKTDDVDLQQQMAAVRNNLDRNAEAANEAGHNNQGLSDSGRYHYPSVSKSRPIDLEREQHPVVPPKFPALVPERPPKEPTRTWQAGEEPPVPPPNYNHSSRPTIPPKAPLSAPVVPKKERLTFKPGAYLENGDPIRSMFIPSKLRRTFLEIAAKNTAAGLEMCGILCGSPVNNALFVRCLIIPDQVCTSDTVETVNEGTLAEYCMNEDLLVLGWIHTHPTQTCFMSSRDLHTHAGYQIMMAESVAIVCAPKFKPSYGIFRLTHPPGLNHILDCKQTSTFHPHSLDNLYCETEHPTGHVYESDKMPFEVKDLRTQ
ncbi:endosome-associated ubiquitin isopeptidase (AmsH), putative [Cordyceps militaris CM01]|uniref:Endosome-associated ubiquitin isopeptidase (AmsH), putative n=2 Tax=Cordyceps militaris TaxID=73501 RepID=G3J482_CORMM|nr:endosome-associated ubiquitin isopeptidase (AmsH), putative [Cordyceps militaris CM01]ATY65618.1 Mov34 MPN PAD-1 [Cordyceps militaris]EGX95804.1 endosome-associated ubiquitin isopeptidase (AmsH), putative [Cordyceps militaris CM01]